MREFNFYTTEFDATKPYAEVTVLADGVSALGQIRRAGEVILVNYGSDQWEGSVNVNGVSYFENPNLFSVRRVEPPKDTTVTPSVVVVTEDVAETITDAVPDAEEVIIESVEVSEDTDDVTTVVPKTTRATSRRNAKSN